MRRSAVFATLATAALVLAGISGGATRHGGAPLHADTAFVAAGPQSTADCLKNPDIGFRCYSPAQIATAYGLDKLYAAGIDGSGTTIAVVIPFGSPTIQADLQTFEKDALECESTRCPIAAPRRAWQRGGFVACLEKLVVGARSSTPAGDA